MNGYPHELRLKVKSLYEQGESPAHIAKTLGVPRTTINEWLYRKATRDRKGRKSPSRLANVVKGPTVDQDKVEARLAEEERYAHFYNDPNVALLGDPPLHRSALGQKLRAEGKL